MSDNIPPFDLQVDIMKRLPVKFLLRFRSVSKSWKSVIENPRFVARYSGPQQHLLVRDMDKSWKYKYDYIVDDDTFPHQRVSITLPPQCDTMLKFAHIIGSSHGLFSLHNYDLFEDDPITKAVIWNPSIRKAVDVVVPKVVAAVVVPNAVYETHLGFGVCGETSDPKIVKIAYPTIGSGWDKFSIRSVPWQVEVSRLSTGSWRTLYSSNYLSCKSIRLDERNMVVVDGVHYWLANERITRDGESRYHMLIVSFDVTSEEFREVNLPDSVAYKPPGDFSIYELRGSPVVLQRSVEGDDSICCVWMMEEEGVPKSFTKLWTFSSHTLNLRACYVKGFRKTGELIIETDTDYPNIWGTLAVCDPYSDSLNDIGVIENDIPRYVYSYAESLLLL